MPKITRSSPPSVSFPPRGLRGLTSESGLRSNRLATRPLAGLTGITRSRPRVEAKGLEQRNRPVPQATSALGQVGRQVRPATSTPNPLTRQSRSSAEVDPMTRAMNLPPPRMAEHPLRESDVR